MVIATRFYDQTKPERIHILVDFIKRARECAEHVLIAVNSEADVTNALEVVNEELRMPGVRAFPVTPWNHPTGPLNSLVLEAARLEASRILFASAEVKLTPKIIMELVAKMSWNTLVVGAVVAGHHHSPSNVPVRADGYTVPWNTCALWNMRLLDKLGFPLVTNAPFDIALAGNEELVTIAVYQKLSYYTRAVLLKTSQDVSWNTANFDRERRSQHEIKMATKNRRSMAQLIQFGNGLPAPIVIHV